jgi:hypothetical protein
MFMAPGFPEMLDRSFGKGADLTGRNPGGKFKESPRAVIGRKPQGARLFLENSTVC